MGSTLLLVCFLTNIPIRVTKQDVSVIPLNTKKDYNAFLNKTHCLLISGAMELKPYFFIKDVPTDCLRNTCNLTYTIPDYMYAGWDSDFINNKFNFEHRRCTTDGKDALSINFVTKEITTGSNVRAKTSNPETGTNKKNLKITTESNIASIHANTSNIDTDTNSNLYMYVGIGVGVFVLIVLIQTICIVSYSRKVANTRRALETVLHRQEGGRDANDRYSVGPVAKKKKNTTAPDEEDDNLYESLEHLARAAVKGDGDTIKSYNIKDRPQLPLPHEMTSLGRGDGGTVKSLRIKDRPRLPLPHEMLASGSNVKTLPHKFVLQKAYFERYPEPSNASMTMPRGRKLMQGSSVNTLSLTNTSQLGSRERLPEPPINAGVSPLRVGPNVLLKSSPVKARPPLSTLSYRNASQEPRERFPEPPINANMTSPRLKPNVLPKNSPSTPVIGRPLNTLVHKNLPHQGSSENLHGPSINISKSPRMAPPALANKPVTSNVANELNKLLSKQQNPPVDSNINEGGNSSDEEWTYEKLPPMKKYLR